MNKDIANPIKLKDGNIPEPPSDEYEQPSPEDVYNRICSLEHSLKTSWDHLMNKMKFIILNLNHDIDKLRAEVISIKSSQLRVGSSVVILRERKIGVITEMSETHVIVKIDEEETIVRKRHYEVQKIG